MFFRRKPKMIPFSCREEDAALLVTGEKDTYDKAGREQKAHLSSGARDYEALVVNGQRYNLACTTRDEEVLVTSTVEVWGTNECNQWSDGSCHCENPEICHGRVTVEKTEARHISVKTYLAVDPETGEEKASGENIAGIVEQLL